jgi:hypothetical protein
MKRIFLLIVSAAILSVVTAAQSNWPFQIVNAVGGPVRVTNVAFRYGNSRGDVLISIENASRKRIRAIEYNLAGAVCPRSEKLVYPIFIYGDPKALGFRSQKASGAPIAPTGTAVIQVAASTYSGLVERQRSDGCASEAKPEFTVQHVVFCDGTGWEGFADGPDHSLWNGRPWTPPDRTPCVDLRQ